MTRRNLLLSTALITTMAVGGCQASFHRAGQPQYGSDRPSTTTTGGRSITTTAAPRSPVRGASVSPASTSSTREPGRSPSAQTTSASPSGGMPSKSKDSGPPDVPGPFTLTVRASGGDIEAPVAPLSVDVRADGTADKIDPPHGNAQQWLTAAWIEQSPFPGVSAGGGPSFIYGHACHHHVCSFTRLRDAHVGDAITVTTPARVLTYRLCATGSSAKSGNLRVPSCDGADVDLVLVTCEYEQGGQSTHNLVVAATLMSKTASAH